MPPCLSIMQPRRFWAKASNRSRLTKPGFPSPKIKRKEYGLPYSFFHALAKICRSVLSFSYRTQDRVRYSFLVIEIPDRIVLIHLGSVDSVGGSYNVDIRRRYNFNFGVFVFFHYYSSLYRSVDHISIRLRGLAIACKSFNEGNELCIAESF